MTFKEGQKLIATKNYIDRPNKGDIAYFVCEDEDGWQIIECEGGWKRDERIPEDYKPKQFNRYWCIKNLYGFEPVGDEQQTQDAVSIMQDKLIKYVRERIYEEALPPIITTTREEYKHATLPSIGESYRCSYGIKTLSPKPLLTKRKSRMASILRKIAKSDAQKALEHFRLVDECGDLTERGRNELLQYIFDNGAFNREDFETKLIKQYKEETK